MSVLPLLIPMLLAVQPVAQAQLCEVQFPSGDLRRQVLAHARLAPGSGAVLQCPIHDGPGRNARLIGIEYIVSAEVFQGLPAEEKKLWHSHAFAVKSGALATDRSLLKKLAGSYGKAWHTWQADRDSLPLGIPRLMMGLTGEGQGDPKLLAEQDRILGGSGAERRRQRTDLPEPAVDPAADAWIRGAAPQLEIKPATPTQLQRIPMH